MSKMPLGIQWLFKPDTTLLKNATHEVMERRVSARALKGWINFGTSRMVDLLHCSRERKGRNLGMDDRGGIYRGWGVI